MEANSLLHFYPQTFDDPTSGTLECLLKGEVPAGLPPVTTTPSVASSDWQTTAGTSDGASSISSSSPLGLIDDTMAAPTQQTTDTDFNVLHLAENSMMNLEHFPLFDGEVGMGDMMTLLDEAGGGQNLLPADCPSKFVSLSNFIISYLK